MSLNCSPEETLKTCLISIVGKNQQKFKVDKKNKKKFYHTLMDEI